MTNYDYDEKFKDNTIQIILDELEELDKWSVYNDDKYGELLETIKKSVKIMRGE